MVEEPRGEDESSQSDAGESEANEGEQASHTALDTFEVACLPIDAPVWEEDTAQG